MVVNVWAVSTHNNCSFEFEQLSAASWAVSTRMRTTEVQLAPKRKTNCTWPEPVYEEFSVYSIRLSTALWAVSTRMWATGNQLTLKLKTGCAWRYPRTRSSQFTLNCCPRYCGQYLRYCGQLKFN